MTINPRQLHDETLHFIRYDFSFSSPSSTVMNAGVNFGSLPAGAVPIRVDVAVDTAFNNGTNNLISVGYTATGTDLVNGASLASQALVTTAAPAAAIATAKQATSKTGTQLYVSTSQTGTAATTGTCSLIIYYVPNI